MYVQIGVEWPGSPLTISNSSSGPTMRVPSRSRRGSFGAACCCCGRWESSHEERPDCQDGTPSSHRGRQVTPPHHRQHRTNASILDAPRPCRELFSVLPELVTLVCELLHKQLLLAVRQTVLVGHRRSDRLQSGRSRQTLKVAVGGSVVLRCGCPCQWKGSGGHRAVSCPIARGPSSMNALLSRARLCPITLAHTTVCRGLHQTSCRPDESMIMAGL